MARFKLHHHIPLIGRPFLQRNQARLERDQALKERDELRSDLAAIHTLFAPPGQFYSPVVDPVEADRHISQLEANPLPLSLEGIEIERELMVEKWSSLLAFLHSVPFSELKSSGFRYAFGNPYYSWGDGSILYAMLRIHQPRRVIEVGSGWSSACALDTADRYFKSKCEFVFVDPYPQLLLSLIGNPAKNVQIIELAIQQVPLATFKALEAGDILFIDSTHVLRTGSDVCFELFEVLPSLASGVLVHFHDMFWPFEYPRLWAVDQNRSWNELYAIRAFLTNNDNWRVIFFNDYFAKTERELIAASYPDFLKNSGGALWLQRR
jgi:Methyltransferase domain